MSRGSGARVCVCVCRGGGDLLPWPIKWGFAFDSILKETDEPAEPQYFSPCVSVLVSISAPQLASQTNSIMIQSFFLPPRALMLSPRPASFFFFSDLGCGAFTH